VEEDEPVGAIDDERAYRVSDLRLDVRNG